MLLCAFDGEATSGDAIDLAHARADARRLQVAEHVRRAGPGRREFTDFVDGKAANADRRRAYLQTAAELLVDDLTTLTEAWKPAANNYRTRFVKDKAVLRGLFDTLASRYGKRPGGYSRVLKLAGNRHGDNAQMALITLAKIPVAGLRTPGWHLPGEFHLHRNVLNRRPNMVGVPITRKTVAGDPDVADVGQGLKLVCSRDQNLLDTSAIGKIQVNRDLRCERPARIDTACFSVEDDDQFGTVIKMGVEIPPFVRLIVLLRMPYVVLDTRREREIVGYDRGHWFFGSGLTKNRRYQLIWQTFRGC